MKLKIVPTTKSGIPNANTRYKKIGKTTYVVTSVFNQNARSDVVGKIARLIEREAIAN